MLLDLLSLDGPAPPTSTTTNSSLAGLLDDPVAKSPLGNLSLDGGAAKGPPVVVDPFADLTSSAMSAPAPSSTSAPSKFNTSSSSIASRLVHTAHYC